MRYVFGFLCVCALGAMPLVGCGETNGGGGSGGSGGTAGSGGMGGEGGTGGTDWGLVGELCQRLDECGALMTLIGGEDPLRVNCIDPIIGCLDANSRTQPVLLDWVHLVLNCLELSTCPAFVDCYMNDVPIC